MATGLPYDSDAGRDYAACLTAILCGQAYLQSSRIAELCPTLDSATELTARAEHTDGACPGYFINREPFLDVIRMHRASVAKISRANVPASLLEASQKAWDEALVAWRKVRLPQLAGHRAGSDRHHRLHDGLRHHGRGAGPGAGEVQEAGWRRHDEDRQQHGSRGAVQARLHAGAGRGDRQLHRPERDDRGRAATECRSTWRSSIAPSSRPRAVRSIVPMGHLKMMAAVQPFISGAISKTINMPTEATVEEIANAYLEAWKQGIKAVAIYRDGSKQNQVMTTKKDEAKPAPVALLVEEDDLEGPPRARRNKLPRRALLGHAQVQGGLA